MLFPVIYDNPKTHYGKSGHYALLNCLSFTIVNYYDYPEWKMYLSLLMVNWWWVFHITFGGGWWWWCFTLWWLSWIMMTGCTVVQYLYYVVTLCAWQFLWAYVLCLSICFTFYLFHVFCYVLSILSSILCALCLTWLKDKFPFWDNKFKIKVEMVQELEMLY